jgi:glycosyltransferase involved in cell wall biosynthesis/peptidoglycan/xylan/chitin deacetylase (PgdA/CDA1 family)
MAKVLVTTSWDDGHVLDLRVADLLRKYGLTGTFYVSPECREFPSHERLNEDLVRILAEDFEIGAHTQTHPRLTKVDQKTARWEMESSKAVLESWIGRPIRSFCYPGGQYRAAHALIVRELGFLYARTTRRFSWFVGSRWEAETTIHAYQHWSDWWHILLFSRFNLMRAWHYFWHWDALAMAQFDACKQRGSVFHLWGHSWEIDRRGDWDRLERVLAYISDARYVQPATNAETVPATLRPKVMISSPYYPPHPGGLEHYAEQMAVGLQDKGWEAVVVTTGEKNYLELSEQHGVRVYRLPVLIKLSNTPLHWIWWWQVRRIMRHEQPDVVNVHLPVPGLPDVAAWAAGRRPVVVTYHSISMLKGTWWPDVCIWPYEKIALKFLLRKAHTIISSSDYVRDSFLRLYRHKATTIRPGFHASRFQPAPTRQPSTLMFVAGLNATDAHKGLPYLFEITRRLAPQFPALRVQVVGDGDRRGIYEAQCRDLGIADRVDFRGRLVGHDLVEAFQQSGILVHPTTNDSSPTVIIEAFACGLPVVSTDIGGIKAMIGDGVDGFVLPPRDVDALERAVRLLLADHVRADQMGQAGLAKVHQHMQWSQQISQTHALLEEIRVNAPRPRQIVHVVAYFPPHLGGMERVAQEVAETQARNGHAVTVLTSRIGGINLMASHPRLRVHQLHGPEVAHTPLLWTLLPRLLLLSRHTVVHLHLSQAYAPELVWLASQVRGFAYVVHFHLDTGPSGVLGRLYLLYKRTVMTRVLRDAASVIALSEVQRHVLEQKYGVRSEAIRVIPNGVAPEYFVDKAQNLASQPLQLLYVGRLSVQKRVDRIIKAMAHLDVPVELTIVGDGEDRSSLEALAKSLSLRHVQFVGSLTGQALRDAYAAADAFVLPSDREGMPLVVLEAMAAGLPIIGSDVVGIRELVDGVGILVKDPGAETFAAAIQRLEGDKRLRVRLSDASKAHAQKYAWPGLVLQMQQLYEEVGR